MIKGIYKINLTIATTLFCSCALAANDNRQQTFQQANSDALSTVNQIQQQRNKQQQALQQTLDQLSTAQQNTTAYTPPPAVTQTPATTYTPPPTTTTQPQTAAPDNNVSNLQDQSNSDNADSDWTWGF